MRWALRFALCASILVILILVLLKNKLEDFWDQYDVTSYIGASWQNTFQHGSVENIPTFSGQRGDKVIIMAKLEKENTDWVAKELPDWQAAIYTVNPTPNTTTTALTTPLNKGHEAMAYLSYIIDNYNLLPTTLTFLHSHRSGFLSAWHTDAPLHDNVAALRALKLPFVQKNGYVNLRCNWNPGCLEAHRDNAHVTPEVWADVFRGTSTEGEVKAVTDGKGMWKVGAACCAQFAVSREQVLKRPLGDYERLRAWIVETEKSDAMSGRVMEFLWHVVFGKEAVYCPDEKQCYCDVYGRC